MLPNSQASVDIELKQTLYRISLENADSLLALQDLFPWRSISKDQLEFEPGPIRIKSVDLDDLHNLVSDLGNCMIRATEEGFSIVVGGD